MLSIEVALEPFLGNGSNYASWSASVLNVFRSIDPHLEQTFYKSIFLLKLVETHLRRN
jgi:hypothetical protein